MICLVTNTRNISSSASFPVFSTVSLLDCLRALFQRSQSAFEISGMGKRVAIIGAGPSGLPAIRHALLYGCEPICFEADDKVGGLWNYKPNSSEEASVMKSTIINSSKEMTAYSDFPPKPEFANYMHNQKLLEYFQDYAKFYDLTSHIRFKHKVINISRSSTYAADGCWDVEFIDLLENSTKKEKFDAVLLGIGHHKTPNWPEKWPGQDKFKGKIIHSHDYKEPTGYEDQRIVAVGIGNSGGDIAVELSRVASQVWLSTRRGSWICSRMLRKGMPMDISLSTRFADAVLIRRIPRKVRSWILEQQLEDRFDHAAYGMKPSHDVFGAHLTTNDDLPGRIISGTVRVKPNIARFTETDVVFTDGSVVENVDAVILSTGYKVEFPIIEQGSFINVHDNYVDLYKFMFPLDQPHHSLAVLGLVQPLGSIMPIAEMQARTFFAVLTGASKLPANSEMREEMLRKREAMKTQYYGSPRHTLQCGYMEIMDEMATIIGCRPQFLPVFLKDPILALKCTFGPCAPYVYRVSGPHKWDGARDAILGIQERVLLGLNPDKKPIRDSNILFNALLVILLFVVIVLLL